MANYLVKLDIKDRKILYQLDLDSRQSFRSIGRKIGLSKDIVASRLKRLQNEGIINACYVYFDAYRLGYTFYRFYFVFQYITPEIRKEIIQGLVNIRHSCFVTTCEGRIELSVYFAVKNEFMSEFEMMWDKFYSRYRNYFARTYFSIWTNVIIYPYSFLINDEGEARADKNCIKRISGKHRVEVDELDLQILQKLFQDARIPTTKLAESIDVSPGTIAKRIKTLHKKGIIIGYNMDLNFSKLDYNLYKLDIELGNPTYKTKINEYITNNPHVRARYISLGDTADLEYEINLKDVNQLHELMEKVTRKYPSSIRTYTYFNSLKKHKIAFETLNAMNK